MEQLSMRFASMVQIEWLTPAIKLSDRHFLVGQVSDRPERAYKVLWEHDNPDLFTAVFVGDRFRHSGLIGTSNNFQHLIDECELHNAAEIRT